MSQRKGWFLLRKVQRSLWHPIALTSKDQPKHLQRILSSQILSTMPYRSGKTLYPMARRQAQRSHPNGQQTCMCIPPTQSRGRCVLQLHWDAAGCDRLEASPYWTCLPRKRMLYAAAGWLFSRLPKDTGALRKLLLRVWRQLCSLSRVIVHQESILSTRKV